jgi:hypothetical protein
MYYTIERSNPSLRRDLFKSPNFLGPSKMAQAKVKRNIQKIGRGQ